MHKITLKNSNKKKTIKIRWMYFRISSHILSRCEGTCSSGLMPLPKSHGKLLHRNVLHDPFPSLVEALLGQEKASQLLLHYFYQELVCQNQTWWIRGWGGGGCRTAGCCWWPSTSREWTGAFSQQNNHSITGLFFVTGFMKLPRAFMTWLTLILVLLGRV